MRVIPIAWTMLHSQNELFNEVGFPLDSEIAAGSSDLDILSEFSGRNCYQSFNKPNPKTASNKDYLANILGISHESVLEHGSVTFYVEGVSRNLLLELERHRHLSFSVLSTRYVDPSKMKTALHPNTPREFLSRVMDQADAARKLATEIYEDLVASGWKKKQAREAARQVLPGNTETKFVVTGNIRAWRYVIKARIYEGADVEIQQLAQEILAALKRITPNSVQDL